MGAVVVTDAVMTTSSWSMVVLKGCLILYCLHLMLSILRGPGPMHEVREGRDGLDRIVRGRNVLLPLMVFIFGQQTRRPTTTYGD